MAEQRFSDEARWTFLVRVGVSVVALGASLYIILVNSYPDSIDKWAFATAGLVIGYWFR